MTYTLAALCFVGIGVYFLLFIAPHMPEPVNKCRLFIIVKKDQPKEKDEKIPWWVTTIIILVVILGQTWPAFGYTVLGLGLLAVGILKLIEHMPNIMDIAMMHFINTIVKRREKVSERRRRRRTLRVQ